MARPRQISNEQIIEAARASIYQHGPHVSTDIIAKELGVSSPALLKRFGSKEDLIVTALAPPEHPPFLEAIEQGPNESPLDAQLVSLTEEITSWLRSMMPRFAALRTSGLMARVLQDNYDTPPLVRTLEALTGWFARAARLGLVNDSAPETMASMMLGSIHIQIFMTFMTNASDPEEVNDYLTEAMGLLTRSFSATEHQ